MAFPQSPLAVRVDLQIGGAWTDITADTLARDGANSITITRGRADEASRADPSTCKLSLKNPTGKYSPRNPVSPYYGLIGRNTPLRVGVGTPPAATWLAGQSGTSIVAPSVTAETNGNLFCVWAAAPVGNITGPGGFAMGTEQDGALTTWNGGSKGVVAGATGTSVATFSTPATAATAMSILVPGPGSSTVGFSSTVDTTGGGNYATLTAAVGDYILLIQGWSSDPNDLMRIAPSGASTPTCGWLLVADTGPSAGPRIRAWMRRVTVAGTQDAALYGPQTTAADCYTRAWVITGATDYFPRFVGEVSEWPPMWDLSGKDVWVPIQASGITRRLGQGSSPLRSTLERQILSTPSLVAYWPMEEPAGASSFGSALSGGSPMRFVGAPVLGADDGFACSEALATFTAAGAKGPVPPYTGTGTGRWVVGALISIPPTGVGDGQNLLKITTTGTLASWALNYDTTDVAAGTFRLSINDASGTLIYSSAMAIPAPSTAPAVTGSRFLVYISVDVAGGTGVAYQVEFVPIDPTQPDFPQGQPTGTTILASTAGRVTSVAVGAGASPGTMLTGSPSIGHVAVASDPAALFTVGVWNALVAWSGETAAARVVRLCRETGNLVHVQYLPTSKQMGPQGRQALLDLLAESETTDLGFLHEAKGFAGIVYRTRASAQNQTAALTLSYSGGNISEPLEPVDDDQRVVNDVTVNRPGGSSARATLDAGALSTAAPPAGVGRYDTSIEVNAHADTDLPDHAAWRLHMGTWDETRYPAVHVDLAKNPGLVGALTAADVGDLITLTGLPTAFLPPGDGHGAGLADVILEGYTETLGHPIDWDITLTCGPGGPYRVGVTDSATYGRADSLTSTMNGGFTATDTAISVSVAAGSAPWITSGAFPTHFPFDIIAAGEVMTVTAIGPVAFGSQPFTVTRSVNGVVKAQIGGTQVRLARPTVVAL